MESQAEKEYENNVNYIAEHQYDRTIQHSLSLAARRFQFWDRMKCVERHDAHKKNGNALRSRIIFENVDNESEPQNEAVRFEGSVAVLNEFHIEFPVTDSNRRRMWLHFYDGECEHMHLLTHNLHSRYVRVRIRSVIFRWLLLLQALCGEWWWHSIALSLQQWLGRTYYNSILYKMVAHAEIKSGLMAMSMRIRRKNFDGTKIGIFAHLPVPEQFNWKL